MLIRSPERGRTGFDCHLVPIDACYELAGRLRLVWRGFDGGQDAHAAARRRSSTRSPSQQAGAGRRATAATSADPEQRRPPRAGTAPPRRAGMSELDFAVRDIIVEPYAAAPQLTAKLRVQETTGSVIHAIALRCQIQIEPQRRGYEPDGDDRPG